MANGKKTGGRVKGSLTKRTQSVKEMMDKLDVDPLEAMANCLKEAINEKDTPNIIYIADKLAPYVAPKLSASKVEAGVTIDRENVGLQETNEFLAGATSSEG